MSDQPEKKHVSQGQPSREQRPIPPKPALAQPARPIPAGKASHPVRSPSTPVAPQAAVMPETAGDNDTPREATKRSRGQHFLPGSREHSSHNAEKHGLLAQRLIKGESAEEFSRLREKLKQQFDVEDDTLEALMLERIQMCHWRLRRLWRIEAELMEHLRAVDEQDSDQRDTHLGTGVQRELNTSVSFESLQRYEANIERQLHRAIGELLLLKKIIPSLESGQAQINAYQKLLG